MRTRLPCARHSRDGRCARETQKELEERVTRGGRPLTRRRTKYLGRHDEGKGPSDGAPLLRVPGPTNQQGDPDAELPSIQPSTCAALVNQDVRDSMRVDARHHCEQLSTLLRRAPCIYVPRELWGPQSPTCSQLCGAKLVSWISWPHPHS